MIVLCPALFRGRIKKNKAEEFEGGVWYLLIAIKAISTEAYTVSSFFGVVRAVALLHVEPVQFKFPFLMRQKKTYLGHFL